MSLSAGESASQAPDDLNRFLAFLVDVVIAGILSSVPCIGGALGAGYFVVRDGLDLDFMNHRSLGKNLLSLQVHRLDGQSVDLQTSVRRNWMFGLGPVTAAVTHVPLFGGFLSPGVGLLALVMGGYEVFRVITRDDGRRWGDDLAQTQVTTER